MASGEKKCPQCAEGVKVDAKVCKHCGYTFSEAELSAAKARADRANLAGGIGCLTFIALIVIFFVWACSSDQPASNTADPIQNASERAADIKAAAERSAESHRFGRHCASGDHFPMLVDRVKRTLLDPDSFELIDTRSAPVDSKGKNQVVMRYRAKNRGGLLAPDEVIAVLDNKTCFFDSVIDSDGKAIP